MPSKKKKNQGRNAFYYFMISLRPQLERQGVVLENGMQTLAEIAGPRWKDLPDHEKEVYQEMAHQAKSNKKFQPARYDRMDCTGQLISRRVDTVSLNERRRNGEREEVRREWPPGTAVCDEKFYMIGFMSLCELENGQHLPCELGVVEYSLNGGIHRSMHKFIDPGQIPTGYRYTAISTSEKTHKIPVVGLAEKEDTYRRIWLELLKFVNPEGQTVFPPIYSRISETKLTEICLNWLAKHAEMPNKLKKVYELEGLICDLHSHSSGTSQSVQLSKSQSTELLSTTVFDYEPGSKCKWHDQQEVKYCALGTVLRYCYCMSDLLCPIYNIPLTSCHLPERPEGTYCTVLKPAQYGEERSRQRQQAATASRGGAAWEDSGPYGAQDYRYKEEARSSPYTRRGPTYDEQPEGLQLQQPPRGSAWQPAQARAELPAPSAAPTIGRGRGRGRAVVPNQPLRRPNIPGMAAAGAVEAQRSVPGAAWSSVASSETQSTIPDNSIPDWSRLSAARGPGVGRGSLQMPSAKPKVYAGSAAPPPPSHAPPPPLAWQQQVPVESGPSKWGVQRDTRTSGLEAQMYSLGLNGEDQRRW